MIENANLAISECENCHAVLRGDFCHDCGQARKTNLLAFSEFALTLLGSFLSYDSKVNRTLIPLLMKPGSVCNEYLHGHRARFIAPMKLYLFCSVIFFLLMPMFSDVNMVNMDAAGSETVQQEIQRELREDEDLQELVSFTEGLIRSNVDPVDVSSKAGGTGDLASSNDSSVSVNVDSIPSVSEISVDFFNEEQNEFLKKQYEKAEALEGDDYKIIIKNNLPGIMFFMLPLFALILKITNIFKGRLYSEHFVVALYAQSYVFIMMCLLNVLEAVGEYFTLLSQPLWLAELWSTAISLGFTWMMVHLFLMQKSIYKQSWSGGVAQYFLNMFLYTLMFGATFLVALLWDFVTLDV